jgi:hypothetical protein
MDKGKCCCIEKSAKNRCFIVSFAVAMKSLPRDSAQCEGERSRELQSLKAVALRWWRRVLKNGDDNTGEAETASFESVEGKH